MQKCYEILDQMESDLNVMANNTNGIAKCALILQFYQSIQTLREELREKEEKEKTEGSNQNGR